MKPDKLLCCLFSFAFRPCTNNNRIWNVFEQLTNRNVFLKIFNCGVNVKTKDCAESRPFQHKLQHNCFHGKVSKPVPQLTNAQNKRNCLLLGKCSVQWEEEELYYFGDWYSVYCYSRTGMTRIVPKECALSVLTRTADITAVQAQRRVISRHTWPLDNLYA